MHRSIWSDGDLLGMNVSERTGQFGKRHRVFLNKAVGERLSPFSRNYNRLPRKFYITRADFGGHLGTPLLERRSIIAENCILVQIVFSVHFGNGPPSGSRLRRLHPLFAAVAVMTGLR
jgi:hypothetical protein